jgi:hypothetical protein
LPLASICVWFDAFDGGICVCGMITTMFSTAENIVLQLHKKSSGPAVVPGEYLAPPCRDYHMSMLRLAVTAKPAISAMA